MRRLKHQPKAKQELDLGPHKDTADGQFRPYVGPLVREVEWTHLPGHRGRGHAQLDELGWMGKGVPLF